MLDANAPAQCPHLRHITDSIPPLMHLQKLCCIAQCTAHIAGLLLQVMSMSARLRCRRCNWHCCLLCHLLDVFRAHSSRALSPSLQYSELPGVLWRSSGLALALTCTGC